VFPLGYWFGYAWLIAHMERDTIHSENHVWAY